MSLIIRRVNSLCILILYASSQVASLSTSKDVEEKDSAAALVISRLRSLQKLRYSQ